MTEPTPIAILHPPGDPPPGLEMLGEEAVIRGASDGAELSQAIDGAQVLMVTDFRSGALEAAWPRAGALQWIHATSAGVDHVMIRQVRESGVMVTNARGVFDAAIAEYVLGAILFFAKDFAGNLANQRQERWRHRDTERVAGKRLVVVGAGSIGGAVARAARAAGLRVEGIASRAREDKNFDAVHGPERLHERLAEADYVAVTAPHTKATHHMLDADAFAAMKESARLINVGRGPVVETAALVDALEAGRLAGAALDVFEEEPLPAGHPLWGFPNVMISAHMAGDFIGWREALTEQFIDNLKRWRRGEALVNRVDGRAMEGAGR